MTTSPLDHLPTTPGPGQVWTTKTRRSSRTRVLITAIQRATGKTEIVFEEVRFLKSWRAYVRKDDTQPRKLDQDLFLKLYRFAFNSDDMRVAPTSRPGPR